MREIGGTGQTPYHRNPSKEPNMIIRTGYDLMIWLQQQARLTNLDTASVVVGGFEEYEVEITMSEDQTIIEINAVGEDDD